MVAANIPEPQHEHGGNSSSSEGEEEMKTKRMTSSAGVNNKNNNKNSTPSTTTILTSSMTTEKHENGNGCEERRFVWFQKEEEQKLRAEATSTRQFEYMGASSNALPASSRLDSKDFKDKVRAGAGAKGRTGSTDFTRGKNAFVRPCTVGWKSQNQPLMRGGGPRTPRQKG
jgi:hypothetical protein